MGLRLLARAVQGWFAVRPPKPAPCAALADSSQQGRPASTRQTLRLKRQFLPLLSETTHAKPEGYHKSKF